MTVSLRLQMLAQRAARERRGQDLLHLARGLVEAHGGALNIEPVAGPGPCFVIRLPLQQDAR